MALNIVQFPKQDGDASLDMVPGWAIIAGNPVMKTWNHYESADGKTLAGVWEASEGTYSVNYVDWEFCHFLEGECILTKTGHAPVTLKAGDVFMIEPGFAGTWQVVKKVKKYYTFVLSGDTA